MPDTPLSPEPIALPGSLDELRAAVEHKRGRTLVVAAAPLPAGSTLLIEARTVDVMMASQADSPAAQLDAIAHHLAHLMCGHQGAADDRPLQAAFPGLLPGKASASLTTARYTPEEEREARTTRFAARHPLPGHAIAGSSAAAGHLAAGPSAPAAPDGPPLRN